MKVLIFIPQSRTIEPSLTSIRDLDTAGHEVVFEFATAGDQPDVPRWENVTHKYQTARKMALEGGYDALFCVEDDIIVPRDALLKLDALQVDIAYGLVTWRRTPHCWSAAYVNGPADADHTTYDMDPNKMRAAWGQVIDVIGCGLFCTLIRRPVLEALDFELRGSRCCDFYQAWDAHQAGFSQRCDTSVLCGHIMNEVEEIEAGAPWRVVWPDGSTRYRYETLPSVQQASSPAFVGEAWPEWVKPGVPNGLIVVEPGTEHIALGTGGIVMSREHVERIFPFLLDLKVDITDDKARTADDLHRQKGQGL